MHEEKDGEVVSMYSATLEPHKGVKDFAPFKEKYQQKSPGKSSKSRKSEGANMESG